jgi:hypothetical protein
MNAVTRTAVPRTAWIGAALSGVACLFLLFDGAVKLANLAPVLDANARLGYPSGIVPGVGILLIACTVLYAIPRTAVLGAVLLTGYLGGAVASHVRIGDPLFPVLFPVFFGALVWAGLLLRDEKLRSILPIRG